MAAQAVLECRRHSGSHGELGLSLPSAGHTPGNCSLIKEKGTRVGGDTVAGVGGQVLKGRPPQLLPECLWARLRGRDCQHILAADEPTTCQQAVPSDAEVCMHWDQGHISSGPSVIHIHACTTCATCPVGQTQARLGGPRHSPGSAGTVAVPDCQQDSRPGPRLGGLLPPRQGACSARRLLLQGRKTRRQQCPGLCDLVAGVPPSSAASRSLAPSPREGGNHMWPEHQESGAGVGDVHMWPEHQGGTLRGLSTRRGILDSCLQGVRDDWAKTE